MRVPTYDNLQVGQTGDSNAMIQGPSGPGAGEIAARQTGALGDAGQRLGDTVSRIQISMQDMANQVRVNDAVNQARRAAQDLAYHPTTGYLNLKGDAALTRPDGQDLPTEYGDKLREATSNIAASLGNEEQRRQFNANAMDLQQQFHGQVESHMLSEFRSHALSVQDGTINLASDDAKRNWSNPDLIGPSLAAAKAAVVQKGIVSGWSASATDAALLTTTSKVHTDVVMAALENGNPSYALSYLNSRKGEMTADDILRVQGHVNQQVWLGQAQSAVQAATVKAMPAIAPTSFDRMTQITLGTESNGQRFGPDGKTLLTSPAGAKGEMQVMDGTSKDPGFGVRPAADDSPDERARVGRDYLQALLQKYGTPAKAWAAYNAGPGKLDAALAEADKDAASGAYRTPGAAEDAWLLKLPKETQAYVAKNMAQLQGSGGQAPRPTELDFVNSALAQLPPGAPPQVVKLVREQAVGQFSVIQKTMNEQGNNALTEAQRWLAQNNGNYAAMPAQIRDAVDRFAPGKSDDLIKYARVFEKGENTTDMVLYNRLAAHPEEMTGMSDSQFEMLKAHLSQSDFKHFANERANYLSGKTSDAADAINTSAMRSALNPRLESLGINIAPSPKDTDGRERLGGIQKFVRDSLFQAQQQTGKKFTPEEVEKHIDSLFAKNVDFKNSLWGTTSSQNLMQMQIGDLPSGAAEGLRTALINNGNKAPTNTDILNLYRKLHVNK